MSLLIDKVAQKLGVSRDRADDLVRDLVESILAETERGSEVHVAGLGSFRRINGNLEFEPESRLATVVNHRFAGLSPIPVQSAADSGGIVEAGFGSSELPMDVAGTEEPSYREADTRDVAGEPELDDLEAPASGEHDGRPPEDRDAAERDEDDIAAKREDDIAAKREDDITSKREDDFESGPDDENGADIVAKLDQLMGDEEPDEGVEGREPDDAAEPVDAAESGDPGESTAPREAAERDEPRGQLPAFSRSARHPEAEGNEGEPRTPAAASPETTSADDRRESAVKDRGRARHRAAADRPRPPVVRRKNRSLFYVALIVILAAAIAGVLYLLSRTGGVSAEPEPFTTESTNGSPEAAEGISPPEDTPPPPEVLWEPGAIDRQAGGYTLVVSSQETIEEANEVARALAATLADEDLPIDVLEGTAGGGIRYRVAVGQFSQEFTANRELRRLADRLPEGAWVLAIRTHM